MSSSNFMHSAIKNEDKDLVNKLIKKEKKCSIEDKTETGTNYLHYAAFYNKKAEIVQFFLDNNLNPNDKGENGNTVLMSAVQNINNSLEPLKTLVKLQDINPNIPNDKGEYPISLAVSNNRPDIVEQLFNCYLPVNVNVTQAGIPLLHLAAEKNETKIVSMLLKHGYFINTLDSGNNTALQTAIYYKSDGVISVLLGQHIDINNQNINGDNALHIASANGSFAEVEILIKKGININKQNKNGNTSLHIVAENNNAKITTLLIKHKIRQDIKNNEGKTAKDVAIDRESGDVVKVL